MVAGAQIAVDGERVSVHTDVLLAARHDDPQRRTVATVLENALARLRVVRGADTERGKPYRATSRIDEGGSCSCQIDPVGVVRVQPRPDRSIGLVVANVSEMASALIEDPCR